MWIKSFKVIEKLYPSAHWHFPVDDGRTFLTFDDGPHPSITPWVLDKLDEFNARATFFCLGKNVEKYPEIYREIIARGHRTGNHTFNHKNGWKTANKDYYEDIRKAAGVIDSDLFRPPYGKIRSSQLYALKKEYCIVMWTLLSMDFDKKISPQQCLKNVTGYMTKGAVVVFHDSEKAEKNMKYALEGTLVKLAEAKMSSESIPVKKQEQAQSLQLNQPIING
ncbi:MAG: hypothetical protein A2W91_00925 [Bacteroidetes bacterium GWF2_38_335]|nr:MAG: hypothetical protein A2W91_00925 [Bacteroidetes bacterium GWF2_38_335]OFY80317.1 MAG: hypothetical protein A2281_17435 [Bacteroidetes bacterium RIFOXYA12_FULL_38_20]HBS88883.1 polysaccharide deacetylase family protein [Bacteroidales bacterium]